MFLEFDENRPETPRVVPALTRLERVLLVVVVYQLLLLSYFFLPASWVQPVKRLIVPEEPIRFVQIAPLNPRMELSRKAAPQPPSSSDLNRPVPNAPPAPTTSTPSPSPPRAAETPQPLARPAPAEAPPAPRAVLGGILGSARKNLDRFPQGALNTSPNAGFNEQGPAIQFDARGVDFGPWLRRFKAQVIGNWFIPQTAEVMHGNVVIQMRVLRNGTLANIQLVRSSGIDAFDRAAMTALRLSTPTLSLPDNYPVDAIDPFTVIFYYNEPIR
jgi:TonB family protein